MIQLLFEFVDITPTTIQTGPPSLNVNNSAYFQSYNNEKEGWVRIIWTALGESQYLAGEQKQLFVMKFKAKANAAPGEKHLTVSQDDSEHWHFEIHHGTPGVLSGGTITITAGSSGGNSSSPSTGSSGGGSSLHHLHRQHQQQRRCRHIREWTETGAVCNGINIYDR